MKIRKMTATFGCLDGAVLELSDGVNTIYLPNEGGKSTWVAFLTCMFYGLDTKRSSRGRLADKERYQPWNGKPMEGTVELSWQGRQIVLQRTSSKGKPFGEFRAWDKNTGLEISSITPDNCGLLLLGVEREVFARSAFLKSEELTVTQSPELSRRLGALAAAGRETDSFLQAENRLKSWQNRLRYHNSGEIPRLERELSALQATPEAPQTEHLPPEDILLRLLSRLQQDEEEMPCPPALEGIAPEKLLDKANKDLAGRRASAAVTGLLALVLAVAAIWLTPLLLVPCALAAGGCLWVLFGKKLPRSYGVARAAQILPAALQWREAEKRQRELVLIIEQVRTFAPQTETRLQAHLAVEQALLLRHRASAAEPADPAGIQAMQTRLEALKEKERAIMLARQALSSANAQLQQTYVPRLTRLAGEYLKSLTLGRYDAVVLSQELEVSVQQAGGVVRPLAAVSSGTRDQTWLALRLAMTALLLPQDAPLVLDDALLTFDRQRQNAAMEVLGKEKRQVLVFTCRE